MTLAGCTPLAVGREQLLGHAVMEALIACGSAKSVAHAQAGHLASQLALPLVNRA